MMLYIGKSFDEKAACEKTLNQANAKVEAGETVSFYELAGYEQQDNLPEETPEEFLARINDPTKWVYGSASRDKELLHSAELLPRFAHLSRKVFMHYGKEHYNPHTISISSELHVRVLIMWTIQEKIDRNVTGYDWELLDNFFLKVIYGELNLELPDDYKPLDREVLPELRGPFFGITLKPSN
jgi:hypothetical protein